jgi:hypothetical protein
MTPWEPIDVLIAAAAAAGASWLGWRALLRRPSALARATIVLAYLVLVTCLLVAGQALTHVVPPKGWTFVDPEYVRGLGTEIGGAGLEALIIGGVAAVAAAWLQRWRDHDEHLERIRRRRRLGREVRLSEEFSTPTRALPLWALHFKDDQIRDETIRKARFSRDGTDSSSLSDLLFEGCALVGVDFRGCDLTNVRFAYSELRRCDFRGAVFRTSLGQVPFHTSSLLRCRFDGAVLEGVGLGGRHRGGSFWGMKVQSGRLPEEVFRSLGDRATIDMDKEGDGFRVIDFWSFISAPSRARIRHIWRQALARELP